MIELSVSSNLIIQVYLSKVDKTKNLNVDGDITFTGNLHNANGVFNGGTIYDSANRLNYEFLKEFVAEGEASLNTEEPTFTQDANIQEPTATVAKTPMSGTEYKYMTFTCTTGATNTPYTITFNEDTYCDILVIGGGGGGKSRRRRRCWYFYIS